MQRNYKKPQGNEANTVLEAVLLDISIDIQDALLKACKKAGVDDYQLDTINEGTCEIFNLNKRKYIERLKASNIAF